ncbi:putative Transposable element Tc1 transposase-like 27 [Homarus americanus]|uniref:Putative Transposable element Tc1 transposase-like 27 n=1 Tax=Homarus americanus TaxID=6706 RepID=A0A8J5JZH7_HOMAM|nr:putative Transposable element Tc1 transposase-like 27 [Homarus americanus]
MSTMQQRLTTCGQIIALREEGLMVRAIADRLAVSTSTLERWIRRYAETERRPRPRLTTGDEDAAIIAAIRNNPFSNPVAIREALHLDRAQTARSRLHEVSIQQRVPAIKERLTDQHRTGRLPAICGGGPGVLVASNLHG